MKKINIHPLTKPEDLTPPDGKTVYIEISERCVYSERENVQFGSWEEIYDSKIEKVTKHKPERWTNYDSMVVSPEVYNADKVYLVAVTYKTGNTFGHSTGNLCVYKIFADKELAKKVTQDILTNGKNFTESRHKDEFPRFCGYFERVEGVELFETEWDE